MHTHREAVGLVAYEPLTLSLAPRRKAQFEVAHQHRNDHAQLHHRQRPAGAAIRAEREGDEDVSAQNKLWLGGPALGHKLVWPGERTGVCGVSAGACGDVKGKLTAVKRVCRRGDDRVAWYVAAGDGGALGRSEALQTARDRGVQAQRLVDDAQ